MERADLRTEVIRLTEEVIFRGGIRAVQVDEIARLAGISKRTLYELFTDKRHLIDICLEQQSLIQFRQISDCRRRSRGSALNRLFKLICDDIDNLYAVDNSFISDLLYNSRYAEFFDTHRQFWIGELTQYIEAGKQQGLILGRTAAGFCAGLLLDTLIELRLRNTAREEVLYFCRIFLRGVATRVGIERLDKKDRD